MNAPRTSPRTAERPMAFTAGEFAAGAGWTWFWFLVLSVPAALPATGLYAIALIPFILVYAGPISLGVLLVLGAPLALLAGLALRRVRRRWVHLVAHALVGVVAGCAGVIVFALVYDGSWTDSERVVGLALSMAPGYLTATAVSAALGWHLTSRRALELDREALTAGRGVPADSVPEPA